MPLKIIKAEEPMPVEQIVVTVYGAPGVGKSTLGYTSDNPLLLDFDKGAYRAANRKDTVAVDSWEDVLAITADDLESYKTIVIDTAGRALDALTASIIRREPKKGRGGSLSLQGYGTLKAEFVAWLKSLRQFGKDVVLLAHMDESRSGDDIVERIDVQGSSKGEIYKSADAMGRIAIKDGKRRLTFSPSDTAFGKNPGRLAPLEVPDPAVDPLFLAGVITAIKTRLNELTEEQREAQKRVESAAEAFDAFETAEQFNAQMAEMGDATKAEKALLVNAAKKKNIYFDKAHKAFVDPIPADEVTA